MEWFYYDDFGHPFDPLSYHRIAIPLCNGNSRLCAIRAFPQNMNGHSKPVITPALQAEITAALSTLTESANVLLKN